MRSSDIFKEYIWLVETIRQSGSISFKELSNKWEDNPISEGRPLSRTTFNRHRAAVERMFNILIECNRSTKEYYIEVVGGNANNSVQNNLVSAISLSNLSAECKGLANRILLDNPPVGGEALETIIRGMAQNMRISLVYHRYGGTPSEHLIEPYCIRAFQQRWYVLGKVKENFYIFSIDRIKECEVHSTTFDFDSTFNPNDYFSDYFGILSDSSVDCTRVIIRAYGYQRFYMRDLPLHHSQRILDITQDYTDFELVLRPTSDFIATIFSRAGYLEVISPKHIHDEIVRMAEEMVIKLKH